MKWDEDFYYTYASVEENGTVFPLLCERRVSRMFIVESMDHVSEAMCDGLSIHMYISVTRLHSGKRGGALAEFAV